MPISEAALAGMRVNGRGWRPIKLGIQEHSRVIGRANDGEDVTPAELGKAVTSIVSALRAYRTASPEMRENLDYAAEELELVSDGDLEDITEEMNRVYDLLDFWRILA